VVGEWERFELIGGEIVPMSPKGLFHENVKQRLQEHWFPILVGLPFRLITETTLRMDPFNFREPDFLFWPRAIALADYKPADIVMLAEVSHSSLEYDLGTKAATYAGLGVPEFWVIDAMRLIIHVHREPVDGQYRSIVQVPPGQVATPLFAPELAVDLLALGLTPAMD
jgi:Uma2 family endonuclease